MLRTTHRYPYFFSRVCRVQYFPMYTKIIVPWKTFIQSSTRQIKAHAAISDPCSFWHVPIDLHFSENVHADLHSFATARDGLRSSSSAQCDPYFFWNHSDLEGISQVKIQTCEDVGYILGTAPGCSARLLLATKAHISLSTTPKVAFHGNNRPPHQQCPVNKRFTIQHIESIGETITIWSAWYHKKFQTFSHYNSQRADLPQHHELLHARHNIPS